MSTFSEKVWTLWETYNGFALIAVVFGVLSFVFPWFTKISYLEILSPLGDHYFIYNPPENLYLHGLFYSEFLPALFGCLYVIGFLLLIFYCTGLILKNRGKSNTPFETHSNSFLKLGIVILLVFTVLSFMQFATPADIGLDWSAGFAFIWVYGEYWLVNSGFYLGVVMIGVALISFLFEKIMLKRHYRKYLPEFQPSKSKFK